MVCEHWDGDSKGFIATKEAREKMEFWRIMTRVQAYIYSVENKREGSR